MKEGRGIITQLSQTEHKMGLFSVIFCCLIKSIIFHLLSIQDKLLKYEISVESLKLTKILKSHSANNGVGRILVLKEE